MLKWPSRNYCIFAPCGKVKKSILVDKGVNWFGSGRPIACCWYLLR